MKGLREYGWDKRCVERLNCDDEVENDERQTWRELSLFISSFSKDNGSSDNKSLELRIIGTGWALLPHGVLNPR